MNLKPTMGDVVGMAIVAVLLLVVVLAALHFQQGRDPAAQRAFKEQRLASVDRMQLALTSASEAEKSAVLSITDEESRKFANESTAATAEVERARQELSGLLAPTSYESEKDLLAQFTAAFAAKPAPPGDTHHRYGPPFRPWSLVPILQSPFSFISARSSCPGRACGRSAC
ncbi:MAG: hypothetical protein WC869_03640 [Phycisphaerae bacterium]|jgi:hypothetical protein